MSKYEDWVEASFKRLADDFWEGIFKPQNESDIKCHLFHTFLHTKGEFTNLDEKHLVFSEFPCPVSQEKIDLALISEKKSGFQPRLLIEIKETNRPEKDVDSSYVRQKIEEDIDKLRRYKKMLEENGNTKVLDYYRPPVIIFFFRKAKPRGIGTRTNDMMKTLKRSYDGVNLLWGPR